MTIPWLCIGFTESRDLVDQILIVLEQVLQFSEVFAQVVQGGNDIYTPFPDMRTLNS